jgi:hypothetical protein
MIEYFSARWKATLSVFMSTDAVLGATPPLRRAFKKLSMCELLIDVIGDLATEPMFFKNKSTVCL